MDVIGFIEKDLGRARSKSPLSRVLLGTVVFALPVALGILMREDLIGVLDARTLLPNLIAALLTAVVFLLSFRRNLASGRALRLAGLGLCLASGLAVERVFFPSGLRTTYPSSDVFWHENLRCFTKGGSTTLITGAWLMGCAFLASAWPSRRWRAIFAVLAGVSGAVMLGFHCDSSSAGHVLIAHLGQGVVLGLRRIFRAGVFVYYCA